MVSNSPVKHHKPQLFYLVLFTAITLSIISGCFPAASNTTFSLMGLQAAVGRNTFAAYCSYCHGDKGQGYIGPAIIGPHQNLAKYRTAEKLLDFISSTMPQDAPGSLSSKEYAQVLAFLLAQNRFVSSDSTFSPAGFGNITLR